MTVALRALEVALGFDRQRELVEKRGILQPVQECRVVRSERLPPETEEQIAKLSGTERIEVLRVLSAEDETNRVFGSFPSPARRTVNCPAKLHRSRLLANYHRMQRQIRQSGAAEPRDDAFWMSTAHELRDRGLGYVGYQPQPRTSRGELRRRLALRVPRREHRLRIAPRLI